MSDTKKPPPPPRHLDASTRKWWTHVCSTYELAEHHVRILALACQAWDRAEEARQRLAKDGTIYIDRFGAPRKHPSVSVEEQARLAFARLIAQLDLEGESNPLYRR
ncbi:MAG: P27 family phage terminase small subunit [Gemmatimonadota bacterium]|nr:P27 family phage terminase small subunit [Gemmatimonadota bacterium]